MNPPISNFKLNDLFKKLADWQTGVLSVIVHFLVILLLGGTVFFQAVDEPEEIVAEGGVFVASSESEAPSGPPDLAPVPLSMPDLVVPLPQSSLTAIVSASTVASSFQVPEASVSMTSMATKMTSTAGQTAEQAIKSISGGGGGGGDIGSWGKSSGKGSLGQGFGKMEKDDKMMSGILYDLKQTNDAKPFPKTKGKGYFEVLSEFIASQYNPEILKDFYQAKKPLYSSQIIIPTIQAEDGPKAFGLEKEVKPSAWFIHYKGGISPAVSGKFRFWGTADDVLVVSINGKTVLDVTLDYHPSKWVPTDGSTGGGKGLKPGDWIELSERETYRIDVLIGERPGGQFRAILLAEQEGKKYENDGNGGIYSVFSTLPLNIKEMAKVENAPKVDKHTIVMTPKRNVFGAVSTIKPL